MLTPFRSRFLVAVLPSAPLAFLLASATVATAEWIKVHDGKPYGISGMALLAQQEDRTEFLVVHDNKKKDEPRLGLVITLPGKVEYHALAWPSVKNLPDNLESISSVPNQHGRFLALAGKGRLFSLAVEGRMVTLLADFELPELPPKVNIEGFSVQKLRDQLVVIWGHRGAGAQRGILYWGLLDLEKKQVLGVSKTEVSVPFPSPSDPHTRHIADLKIDSSGVVWISATNDPGDGGPFVSAVYTVGVLCVAKTKGIRFEPNVRLTPLWKFQNKVEAIEFIPGP
jgi:hypothetical protein